MKQTNAEKWGCEHNKCQYWAHSSKSNKNFCRHDYARHDGSKDIEDLPSCPKQKDDNYRISNDDGSEEHHIAELAGAWFDVFSSGD
jgi:hypothetical protein